MYIHVRTYLPTYNNFSLQPMKMILPSGESLSVIFLDTEGSVYYGI